MDTTLASGARVRHALMAAGMYTARRAGAMATLLLAVAIVVATVIAARILVFEYFHGSAAIVRDLLHRLFA